MRATGYERKIADFLISSFPDEIIGIFPGIRSIKIYTTFNDDEDDSDLNLESSNPYDLDSINLILMFTTK